MAHLPVSAILKMSLRSLKDHKVRSLLALLGIVVGIAALMVTVAMGRGAQEAIKDQIINMGDNYIMIQRGRLAGASKAHQIQGRMKPLTEQDYEAIRAQVPNIRAISPVLEKSLVLDHGGETITASVKAGNTQLFDILRRPLAEGSPMTKYHVKTGGKVVVIGSKVAEELFANENPVGKTLKIASAPYMIVGILEEQEKVQAFGRDPNLVVFIPISVAMRKFTAGTNRSLSSIVMSIIDKDKSEQTVTTLRRILRFRHLLSGDQTDDFVIWDQQALLSAAEASRETLNTFLLAAAGVALAVGGIGIMNIMLVSMTERKREIGVRMAIGAPPKAIFTQFLSESATLCLVGGIIGVLIGSVLPSVITYLTGLPSYLELAPMLTALITAFVVGIIFGFYPAYKASKMNPVEALQYQ